MLKKLLTIVLIAAACAACSTPSVVRHPAPTPPTWHRVSSALADSLSEGDQPYPGYPWERCQYRTYGDGIVVRCPDGYMSTDASGLACDSFAGPTFTCVDGRTGRVIERATRPFAPVLTRDEDDDTGGDVKPPTRLDVRFHRGAPSRQARACAAAGGHPDIYDPLSLSTLCRGVDY